MLRNSLKQGSDLGLEEDKARLLRFLPCSEPPSTFPGWYFSLPPAPRVVDITLKALFCLDLVS